MPLISPLNIGDRLLRCFNSGGNWNNTTYGLASFNGNNARSNANGNIGFRSDLSKEIAVVRSWGLAGSLPVQAVKIKEPITLLSGKKNKLPTPAFRLRHGA